MNPTFGASILSWIPPMWTPEGGSFRHPASICPAGFEFTGNLIASFHGVRRSNRKATIETTRIEGDLFSQPSPRSAYSFLSQGSDSPDQGGAG